MKNVTVQASTKEKSNSIQMDYFYILNGGIS